MQKNNVLLIFIFIPFVSLQRTFGMKRIDAVEQAQVHLQKPAPQTLYNYFGIPNLFAAQASKDIRNVLLKEIMQGNEWWYVIEKDSLKNVPAKLVRYSADGRVLVAACKDTTVRLFKSGGKKTVIKEYNSEITGLVCSPKEPFFVVSLDNETMEKVDYKGQTLKIIKDQSNPKVIAMHPEGTHICTKPYKGQPGVIPELKIWPLRGGVYLRNPIIPDEGVKGFAFCSGEDRNIRITDKVEYRWPDQKELGAGWVRFLRIPNVKLTAVAAHPKITRFAIGLHDGSIKILDEALNEEDELVCFTVDGIERTKREPITQLDFAVQNNRLVASSGKALFAFKRDEKGWNQVARLTFSNALVLSFACNSSHNQIAVASEGDSMRIVERFDNPRFEHMLLRLVLKEHLARCILEHKEPKCPNEKQQSSDEGFMQWMGHAFAIKTGNLLAVWRTFPSDMRKSIMRTYVHAVQKIKGLPAVRKQRQLEEAERENQKRREQSKFLSYQSFGANW